MDTMQMASKKGLAHKDGFTLIELVIVIILIGILAATALPKFANLTTQARNASNQGVTGGLGSAVGISHAAWIAGGSTGTTITLEGTTVSINANGWPDGGAANVTTVTAAQCVTLWNAILNNPPLAQTAATCPTTNTNCYVASATGPTCTYTYGPDSLITITYSIATGATGFTAH